MVFITILLMRRYFIEATVNHFAKRDNQVKTVIRGGEKPGAAE
jgi:hypothetical protein